MTPGPAEIPPRRRPTLADLAILIAAVAVELGYLGAFPSVPDEGAPHPETDEIRGLILWRAIPPILFASAALLVAGSIRPRTARRERWGRPGAIACLACVGPVAWFAALLEIHLVLLPFVPVTHLIRTPYNYIRSAQEGSGPAVLAAWLALALAGAWRPDPGWLDRSGRVLGCLTILAWVVDRVLW